MSPFGKNPVVEATLDYDSARQPQPGTRGFGSQPRMLLYKWQNLIVDLLIWDRGGHICAVHGRVTEDPIRAPVVGAEAFAGTAHVETDQFGQFAVALGKDWVPRRLRVRTPGAEVVCVIPDAPGSESPRSDREPRPSKS